MIEITIRVDSNAELEMALADVFTGCRENQMCCMEASGDGGLQAAVRSAIQEDQHHPGGLTQSVMELGLSGRRRPRHEAGPLVTAAAMEIKQQLSESFITVILPILTTLLPLLLGLCKKPTPEEQQKAAIAAWDGEDYSRYVLTSSTRRARHAAKLNGERLKKDEAREVARAALDKIRLAEPETFSKTWEEINVDPKTTLLLRSYEEGTD